MNFPKYSVFCISYIIRNIYRLPYLMKPTSTHNLRKYWGFTWWICAQILIFSIFFHFSHCQNQVDKFMYFQERNIFPLHTFFTNFKFIFIVIVIFIRIFYKIIQQIIPINRFSIKYLQNQMESLKHKMRPQTFPN